MVLQIMGSLLTILRLNNGCSYEDPALVVMLTHLCRFWMKLMTLFHFEERHFSRWEHFLS